MKSGDNVLVEIEDQDGLELATEICKEAARHGAHPLIVACPAEFIRALIDLTPLNDLAVTPRSMFELMKASDVNIHILSSANTRFLASTDSHRIGIQSKALQPVNQERLRKRWTATLHPTNAYAQEASMSLSEYRDFAYSAMLRDWENEIVRMNRLKKVMEKAEEVHLIGNDTDLSFSIKGRPAVVNDAKDNLPGGEVSTAPVDDSATGKIYYDLPAIYYGKEVTDIRLKFDRGVVVDYSASKNESFLKEMIETDDGSRRLGEFGVGTNRGINRFTRNLLFDEKMAETIHLAIGNAYESNGGINKSAIHWDMIKTMKPGKIFMDGQTVQKDGRFSWE